MQIFCCQVNFLIFKCYLFAFDLPDFTDSPMTMLHQQEVAEKRRKGQMVGGTDHSWSDPTQSHHCASHVSIPASAGSEYASMLEYQNQEHGFSEYKSVIIGSLKKKILSKAEEMKKVNSKNDVYAADEKFGSYSDSGNNSVTGEYLSHTTMIVQ